MIEGLGFGVTRIPKKDALLLAFFVCLFAPQAVRADCATVTMGNKPTGYVFHNADYDVLQVCGSDGNWTALGPIGSAPADPCAGSPSPGDVCADGTIYAGLSVDGNVAMYTTPADAPGAYTWNNGTTNWVDTAMANNSYVTGEANTTLLAGLSDAGSPYAAAVYCDGLSAHGHTDWYLPAVNEIGVLYTNRAAIGGFNTSGSFPAGYYWLSSEHDSSLAWYKVFDGLGSMNFSLNKNFDLSVRCVRR